jgi:adenosylcobinamide kinase / adenosylcobinamide-phosphate guanylyltransferase
VTRTLVLGGSRSGKSRFAESLLAGEAAVDYLATAAAGRPDDPEWTERIRVHQARRPSTWRTVERADPEAELTFDGPAVLLDSITTWLARAMDDTGVWAGAGRAALDGRLDRLCEAWASAARRVVAVSDEVGSGVVPATASGRRFRDELGLLNQRMAATADEAYLVVAGLPLRLK